jgi:homoserine kinase
MAVLTTALAQDPPDPELIYEAMKDKVHQPYRMPLVRFLPRSLILTSSDNTCPLFHQIPGLTEILAALTPQTHPGLLGICLSGAGPTILALATHDFEVGKPFIVSFRTSC